MSYTTDFVNNKKYGADHINGMRSFIMSGGIIHHSDDSCLVTINDGQIVIGAGSALFDDGCMIEIIDEEFLPYDGADCYVYFDRCYADEPKPGKGNTLPDGCIPLAQITGGTITDLRKYSTLKIPSMAPNSYIKKHITLDFSGDNPRRQTYTFTFDDRTEINFLYFDMKGYGLISRAFYNMIDQNILGYSKESYIITYSICPIRLNAFNLNMTVTVERNELTIDLECLSGWKLDEFSFIVM